MNNNKTHLILATIFTAILSLIYGCAPTVNSDADQKQQSVTSIQLIPEDLTTVQSGSLAEFTTFTGTIQPVVQTSIQAQVTDTVLSIHTNIGQSVKKGQILLVLNNQDNQARLNQAQANLSAAQAQLDLNHSLMERKKRLLDQGFISRLEYEQSQLEYRAQRDNVQAQQANVDIAKQALKQATIISPISGYTANRHVEVGQTVAVGQTLFEIIDPSSLEIKGNISASDQSQLKVGQHIEFKIQGQSTPFTATIHRITPVVDQLSRNLEFYAKPVQSLNRLSIGAFVEGKIIQDQTAHGLIIPTRAIQDVRSNPFVWLISNQKIKKVNIRITGLNQQQEQAMVTGLNQGDILSLVNFQEQDVNRPVNIEQ